MATTHHTIIDAAAKQGIKTKVFHSSSVFTAAIGESSLDIYRFGPTTTIPFWSARYKPTSFVGVIAQNIRNSQHTLLLLDLDQKSARPMTLAEATDIIKEAQGEREKLPKGTKVLIIGDAGRSGQVIRYTDLPLAKELANEFAGKTLCMIIPAKPNFAEEEALSKFS